MKAMSKETGRFYAVKMIQVNHVRAAASGSQIDGSGTRSRPDPAMALHKEVKILECLKHPNICQLKEVFYEEHYISMFYLSGRASIRISQPVCRHRARVGAWWRLARVHLEEKRP